MTNIGLFPGIDALEEQSQRLQALSIPEVEQHILDAQNALDEMGRSEIQLMKVMKGENRSDILFFKGLMLSSIAVQKAIHDVYVKQHGHFDLIMGVSLGDISRNAAAKIGSYPDFIKILLKFTDLFEKENLDGSTIQVKLPSNYQNHKDELCFEDYNLTISVMQNDRFFLVTGLNKDFPLWVEEIAEPMGIEIKMMYPFPLHCSLLQPVANGLRPDMDFALNFEDLTTPMYSSMNVGHITNRAELLDEVNLNICRSVYFTDSIRELLKAYHDINFISIGPAPTLLKFLEYMNLDENYTTTDFFQQLIVND